MEQTNKPALQLENPANKGMPAFRAWLGDPTSGMSVAQILVDDIFADDLADGSSAKGCQPGPSTSITEVSTAGRCRRQDCPASELVSTRRIFSLVLQTLPQPRGLTKRPASRALSRCSTFFQVDADERGSRARVLFDPEGVDAAPSGRKTRDLPAYLASEASTCARTSSLRRRQPTPRSTGSPSPPS